MWWSRRDVAHHMNSTFLDSASADSMPSIWLFLGCSLTVWFWATVFHQSYRNPRLECRLHNNDGAERTILLCFPNRPWWSWTESVTEPILVEHRKTHGEGESNRRSITPIECGHADTTQTTATKFRLFRLLRRYVGSGSRGRWCQMLPWDPTVTEVRIALSRCRRRHPKIPWAPPSQLSGHSGMQIENLVEGRSWRDGRWADDEHFVSAPWIEKVVHTDN